MIMKAVNDDDDIDVEMNNNNDNNTTKCTLLCIYNEVK